MRIAFLLKFLKAKSYASGLLAFYHISGGSLQFTL